MNRRAPLLVLCLAVGLVMAGCASGGGSSRGSVSDATAQATQQEEPKGREEGRTRTKNDVHEPGYYDGSQGVYLEEESGGGNFLVGLVASLFSGGDDDEEYDPYDYPDFKESQAEARDEELQTNAAEFGLEPVNKGDDSEDDQGGIDITRSNLSLWYSRSQLAGDAINSFSQFTLMYSGYTGTRYRAHGGLYYGRGQRGSQPNIQEGIRWISEAGLDVGSRGYLTPDHSLLGFYLMIGMRVGALYWSYSNAVETTDGTGAPESISKDGVLIFTPYAGLGTSLLQTKRVHFGVSFTVGGRLSLTRTFEGFDNDLFKPVGEYKLNIEASLFF